MSDKGTPAKKPPAETRTPPQWALHFGLEPPDAAGIRSTGGWALHDQATEAQYSAAMSTWTGGTSHGER